MHFEGNRNTFWYIATFTGTKHEYEHVWLILHYSWILSLQGSCGFFSTWDLGQGAGPHLLARVAKAHYQHGQDMTFISVYRLGNQNRTPLMLSIRALKCFKNLLTKPKRRYVRTKFFWEHRHNNNYCLLCVTWSCNCSDPFLALAWIPWFWSEFGSLRPVNLPINILNSLTVLVLFFHAYSMAN